MRDFEAGLIIESQVSQRSPIFFDHARRRGAQFFGDGTKGAVARRQPQNLTPAFLFDRFNQRRIAMFGTQKLCVGLRSIITILRRCRDSRDHLALLSAEGALWRPHDFAEQLHKRFADSPMRP